jgi:membrane-bound serine protease (ClpP class)
LGLLGSAQAQVSDEVWLIPINTEITQATAQFVRARIERANSEQPLAILLLIDTPGGLITAMEDIVQSVLSRAQVPTLAVVENAFSAGALIAMSAEQLAMLPGSSIGAALPITVTPLGANPVDEKFNSAVRGQFRSVAEARGRDARVAEAMVDQRIEIPGVSTSSELVTLTATQAVEFGIADLQANTLNDALEQFGYGGARIVRLEPNLTERLGTGLANPIVAAALLVIGLGGILIEIFTPGFGIPGGIGILALAVLAVGAFVATPAGVVDLLLILGGILLIALEVLVIPGVGVAGILGLAAIIAAVIRIFQDQSVLVLGWTAIFGGALLAVLLWLLPNSRIGNVLTLQTRLTNAEANPDPAKGALVADRSYLAGATGIAQSDLRPAGVARIAGERIDVVTEGDFISSGSAIEVLRVEGNRVTVRVNAGSES